MKFGGGHRPRGGSGGIWVVGVRGAGRGAGVGTRGEEGLGKEEELLRGG